MAGRVPVLCRAGMGNTGRPPRPIASSVSPSASSEEEEKEDAGTALEGWQVNWEGGRGKGSTKIS